MSELSRLFAAHLKELRRQRHVTQRELATRSGLSLSFIRGLEQGIYTPSFSSIELLARALGVAYRELFDLD